MPCYVWSRSACISLSRVFVPAVTLRYDSSCCRSPSFAARRGAIETINVTSVNNGEQLAIRLRWEDPTHDAFSELTSDVFRDGAAVQFALGSVTLHTHGHNEPFFGMGNRNKPVNIWHWKAGLEETMEAED